MGSCAPAGRPNTMSDLLRERGETKQRSAPLQVGVKVRLSNSHSSPEQYYRMKRKKENLLRLPERSAHLIDRG